MIRIIDVEKGLDYDLPAGVKISIEDINPFFKEDDGSISLPLQLPYTANNVLMLDNPVIERKEAFASDRWVIINRGVYQRRALLSVDSFVKNSYIQVTLLFSEGILNYKIKNTTMQTVFKSRERDDFNVDLLESVWWKTKAITGTPYIGDGIGSYERLLLPIEISGSNSTSNYGENIVQHTSKLQKYTPNVQGIGTIIVSWNGSTWVSEAITPFASITTGISDRYYFTFNINTSFIFAFSQNVIGAKLVLMAMRDNELMYEHLIKDYGTISSVNDNISKQILVDYVPTEVNSFCLSLQFEQPSYTNPPQLLEYSFGANDAMKITWNLGNTKEGRISRWVEYLDRVMTDWELDDELTIFPLCIKQTDNEFTIPFNKLYPYSNYDFLNALAVTSSNNVTKIGTCTIDGATRQYYQLMNDSALSVVIDGVQTKFPVGYSITPFLKMSYVLEYLFAYFGFEFKDSRFHTDPDLKKLTLLNNTIDSLRPGKLLYWQLVPTCTVTEFISSIENDFGCKFIPSGLSNKIDCIFFDEYLEFNKTMLDSLFSSEPVFSINPPSAIKLTRKRESMLFEPSFETYQLFLKSWGTPVEVDFVNAFTMNEGLYYSRIANWYEAVVKYKDENGNEYKTNEYLGLNSFDFYDSEDDYELIDKKTETIFLQMIFANLSSRWKDDTSYGLVFTAIPYLPSFRQLNTHIEKSDGTTSAENESTCPLCYCYRKGIMKPNTSGKPTVYAGNDKLFWGSTMRFDNLGEPDGNLNLTLGGENGMYATFYKNYDDILKKSYNEVKANISVSNVLFNQFKTMAGYMYKYQPLLMENIKYEITNDSIDVVESTFRTRKLYE